MELSNGKKILFLSDYHAKFNSACSNLVDNSHLNMSNSIDLDNFLKLIFNKIPKEKCIDFFLEQKYKFEKKGGAHLQINRHEDEHPLLLASLRKQFVNNENVRVHNFDLSMFKYNEYSSILITCFIQIKISFTFKYKFTRIL